MISRQGTITLQIRFGRLAPVQVAWWGHPDTSGIPTIDYFVTADTDIPNASDRHTEQLVRLRLAGAVVWFWFDTLPSRW